MIRSVSLFDIMNDKKGREIVLSGNKEKLYELLYDLGMDTKLFEVEEHLCSHRPLTKEDKEPWFGTLYKGDERKDRQWIESGNASFEAEVEATGDVSLQRELAAMSREANYYEAAVGKLKQDKKVYNEFKKSERKVK